MNRKRLVITLIVLVALLLTTGGATGQGPGSEGEAGPEGEASIASTVNSRISYQGRLLEDGTPVTGSRDMLFRLYSDGSCGVQVGTDIVRNGVAVSEGLFSVELNVTHWDFDGQGLWLEVEVGSTILGCQEILPVPYALSLRPGAMIADTDSTLLLNRYRSAWPTWETHKYGIDSEVGGAFHFAYGVYGTADNTRMGGVAYGLYGSATTGNGTAYGVYGQSQSDSVDARGVYGAALYTGVEGHATATSGETSGVYGQTDSSTLGAAGVHGYASAISGPTSGVYGESVSESGRGVYGAAPTIGLLGHATASDGITQGVFGRSYSPSGAGVYGTAPNYGVWGESNSPTGTGVYGFASGEGVLGESDSSSGIGVRGKNTSDGVGVKGSSYGGIGVLGLGGMGVGVRGEGNGFAAVDARNAGAGHGVYAESAGPGEGGTAVYAQANDADGIAFWGESNSTDATLVLRNDGAGDLIRGFSHGDWTFRFRVENDGRTTVPVLAITGGSDLSEQFDVTAAEGEVIPGLVVCIDANHPGTLLVCKRAYDRTVAGVVSGAGGIEPGMVMGQEDSPADGAYPVALTGRVYVWADASAGSIQPGDLLTTSDTPGHVIKVTDYERAQGAIIGKAMSSLDEGRGLVLVLVSLQ
jgi:hypothetical protein